MKIEVSAVTKDAYTTYPDQEISALLQNLIQQTNKKQTGFQMMKDDVSIFQNATKM